MGNIEKFDAIAHQYDTSERIKTAQIIASAIRARIAGCEQKSAIDYGCGTGLVGLQLLDNFSSMLFIDASENMIKQVKEKIRLLHEPKADVLCDSFSLRHPDSIKADYIFVVQTLLHEPEIEPLLTNLHAALKEGGHLLIVDFDKNTSVSSDIVHNGFDQLVLSDLLTRLSFEVIDTKTFYHADKIFMNKAASLFILDAVKRR